MATKTIFMKKLILWTLFIFTAFLWSCEDTELHESHSENKNEISIEQFKEETGITDFPKILKIPKNATGAMMRGRDSIDTDDFEIDWSVVKKTAVNDRYNYSFRVLPSIIKSRSIHNLVVYYDLGDWQYSLIEFSPTDSNWSDLIAGSSKVIEGTVREIYNSVELNRSVMIRVPVAFHCTHTGYCAAGVCDECLLCVTWGNEFVVLPDIAVQIIAPTPNNNSSGGGGGSPAMNPLLTVSDPRGFVFAPNLFAPGDPAYTQISRSQEFWNSLDYQQKEWANSNPHTYNEMMSELLARFNDYNKRNFSNLLSLLSNNEITNISAEALAACVTLEAEDANELKLVANSIAYAENAGYFLDPSNSNIINDFVNNNQNLVTDPIFWFTHGMRIFSTQCALIRHENPNLSDRQIYARAMLETAHIILDLGGLAPGFGEVCDIANGVIYTIEGDGVNAALSYASAIPFVGWFSAGVKFARRADRLMYIVRQTDNIITFGGRNQAAFRKKLNMVAGDSRIAHHIIPRALYYHPAIQKAAQAATNQGFHLDTALNGIPVSQIRHNNGAHTNYTNRVFQKLTAEIPANATPAEAYQGVLSVINDIRAAINANPNVTINQLQF